MPLKNWCSSLLCESLNTDFAAASTQSQKTVSLDTAGSSLIARTGAHGNQACPSPAEPAPGSSPLPSTKGTLDSASDHTTAVSPSPRRAPLLLRGKCIRIVSMSLRPHLPLGSLADDQPEFGPGQFFLFFSVCFFPFFLLFFCFSLFPNFHLISPFFPLSFCFSVLSCFPLSFFPFFSPSLFFFFCFPLFSPFFLSFCVSCFPIFPLISFIFVFFLFVFLVFSFFSLFTLRNGGHSRT